MFDVQGGEEQAADRGRSDVAVCGRKVYIWPEPFARMRDIQLAQDNTPRFNLGDLISAGLNVLLARPDASELILAQARHDFVRRVRGGSK